MAVLPVWRSPMISSRLAATNGNHGVDGLDAGLQRDIHTLTRDDAGGHFLDNARFRRVDGAFAVYGLSERIDHAAGEFRPNWDRHNASGTLNLIPFLNVLVRAHDDRADGVLFEVERQAIDTVGELQDLAAHHAGEAEDTRDAVSGFNYGAYVHRLAGAIKRFDLLA